MSQPMQSSQPIPISSQPIPIPDSPRAVFSFDEDNLLQFKEQERYNRSTWKLYRRIVDSRASWPKPHQFNEVGTGPVPESGLEDAQERDFAEQNVDMASSDDFVFELDL